MNYRVVFEPRAVRYLEEQYHYIASQNPRAATKWFNRFAEALQGLSRHPDRYAVARESALVGREIRQMLFGRRGGVHRVFFAVERDTVHILAIRHAAQSDIRPEELTSE
jgi:plasmid stabilization system protein ParE